MKGGIEKEASAAPTWSGSSPTRPQSCLIGADLFDQNDDWQSQHCHVMVEAFSQIDAAQTNPLLGIATQAA